MVVLVAFSSLLLAIALSTGALPAAGFWWDTFGAVGFSAAAVVVFLGWESESPAGHLRLRVHRNLGIVTATLATLHGLGYLVADQTVIEYLKPAVPAYMLAGLCAWATLVGMTITSLPGPRRWIYARFSSFRSWHRGLFAFVIVATGWHVLGTGFSIALPWQQVLAALILIGAPLAAYVLRRRGTALPVTRGPTGASTADRSAIAVALALLLGAVATAAIRQLACAAC